MSRENLPGDVQSRADIMDALRACLELDEVGPVALMLVNPERFNLVNLEHGHIRADEVLREIVAVIRNAAPAARVGLVNSAEYAVLLTGDEAALRAKIADQVHRELSALLHALESSGMRKLLNEAVDFGAKLRGE